MVPLDKHYFMEGVYKIQTSGSLGDKRSELFQTVETIGKTAIQIQMPPKCVHTTSFTSDKLRATNLNISISRYSV